MTTPPPKRLASSPPLFAPSCLLSSALDDFYLRLKADPLTNRFFLTTHLANQACRMANFLQMMPSCESISLSEIHSDMVFNKGLSDEHFNRTAEHLAVSLKKVGFSSSAIAKLMSAVGSLRDEVLCRINRMKRLESTETVDASTE